MSEFGYKEKVLKNKNDVFLSKYLLRKISTRISWIIVKKCPSVTPNKISFLSFVLSLSGVAFFFFFNNYKFIVFGAFILFIANIFDHVDGEIARYKKKTSVTGIFLEASLDPFTISLCIIGITLFLYRQLRNDYIIILGLIATASFLLHVMINFNFGLAFFQYGKKISSNSKPYIEKIKKKNGFLNKISIILYFIKIQKAIFYGAYIIFAILILSIIDLIFQPIIYLYNFPITGLSLIIIFYAFMIPVPFLDVILNYYKIRHYEKNLS